jgi:hypothetical protein
MAKRASVVAAKARAWKRKLARMDGIQGRPLRWADPNKAPLKAGLLAALTRLWVEVHPAAWEYRQRAEGPVSSRVHTGERGGLTAAHKPNKRGRVVARVDRHGKVRSYMGKFAVSQ